MADRIQELVRAVFRSAQAQELLLHWRQIHIDGAVYKSGSSLDECAYREGKRAFIKQIEDTINGSSD